MPGETNLHKMLAAMHPQLNKGEYVFCSVNEVTEAQINNAVLFFKEEEGITLILKKETANSMQLPYSFVASWITLGVHSALEAVGLTAAFSTALAENGISCNVVAGFYHDHIFVAKEDAERAVKVLCRLSEEER